MDYYSDVLQNAVWKALLDLINIRCGNFLMLYFPCRKIKVCAENMDKRIRGGFCPEDAWNMTSIELAQCAEVTCCKIYGL